MLAFYFFALVGLFAFVVWLGCLILFVAGRKQRSRAMAWIGGVPLALLSVSGVVVASWILYVSIVPTNPADDYKSAFGAVPSRDVSELRSSGNIFGDEELTYMTFKASPETIKQLTAKGWNKPIAKIWSEEDEDKASFDREERPNWWKPEKVNEMQFFYADSRRKKFDTEYENLYYDLNSHQAYYIP